MISLFLRLAVDFFGFQLSFPCVYFLFLNRLSFSILQMKSNPATITSLASLVLVADETKRKVMELFGVRPPVLPNWVGGVVFPKEVDEALGNLFDYSLPFK
jgi:hypothetical protein